MSPHDLALDVLVGLGVAIELVCCAGVALWLGIDPSEAHLFQDLAGRILYTDPTLRPSADTLKRNRSGAAALWPYVLIRWLRSSR